MFVLDNEVMSYEWGSRSAIAKLQGRRKRRRPEAELWMGAHPKAPSSALIHGEWCPLNRLIEREKDTWLGPRVSAEFGQLPFLFKVLAADKPLSLQAHPDLARARAGFERENAAGIPLNAPQRNYKDANHKPELICALSPFEALCGFRKVRELLRLAAALACPELSRWLPARPLKSELRNSFKRLVQVSGADRAELRHAVRTALSNRSHDSEFEAAFGWAEVLLDAYPDEIGGVLTLMLNHTVLAPGEALYLPAGNLHAYLRGSGFELMANSDNVLRGGLTPKHVDVPELLAVLNFTGSKVDKLTPVAVAPGHYRYTTPAREFELWRHEISAAPTPIPASDGPQILFALEGRITHRSEESMVELLPGESAFTPPIPGGYSLTGPGVVFRAAVPAAD